MVTKYLLVGNNYEEEKDRQMFACLDFTVCFIQNFNQSNKFHAYTNKPNENITKILQPN